MTTTGALPFDQPCSKHCSARNLARHSLHALCTKTSRYRKCQGHLCAALYAAAISRLFMPTIHREVPLGAACWPAQQSDTVNSLCAAMCDRPTPTTSPGRPTAPGTCFRKTDQQATEKLLIKANGTCKRSGKKLSTCKRNDNAEPGNIVEAWHRTWPTVTSTVSGVWHTQYNYRQTTTQNAQTQKIPVISIKNL